MERLNKNMTSFRLLTPSPTFCAGHFSEITFMFILGMYCSAPGLSQPSGFCYSGYHCAKGAISPTPFKNRVSEHWQTAQLTLHPEDKDWDPHNVVASSVTFSKSYCFAQGCSFPLLLPLVAAQMN